MQFKGPRTFLARPFWRDYVVACVLLGLGFILSSPAAPLHGIVGLPLLVCGAAVFIAAVGWSLKTLWQSRPSRRDRF